VDNPAPRRDAARTRRLVLDAAELIFERDGWRETTLATVGAEAGVSRGTPAYFFASKAGLYAAMGARLVEAARDAANSDIAGAPRDQIISVLSGQLGVVAARPALARLALEYWGRSPERSDRDLGTGLGGLERDLVRRIAELIDAIPGRSVVPEAGGAAAALLVIVWTAGLPGVPHGSVSRASSALSDRTTLLSSLVAKLFVDGDFSEHRYRPPAAEPPSGLSASKSRSWRLPGVG
jgi:AcrR family transcriptional regulator